MKQFGKTKQEIPVSEEITISNYMIEDPQFVNYPDQATQEEIYKYALMDIPDMDNPNILDLGAGRGDLKSFASLYFPEVIYTGVERNKIAVEAGKQKYDGINIINQDIFDYVSPDPHDVILSILTMDINYGGQGEDVNQYLCDYIEHMLNSKANLYSIILPSVTESEVGNVFDISLAVKHLELLRKEDNIRYAIDVSYDFDIFKILIIK